LPGEGAGVDVHVGGAQLFIGMQIDRPLDGQHVLVDVDVEAVFIDAGKIDQQRHTLFVLDDIDRGRQFQRHRIARLRGARNLLLGGLYVGLFAHCRFLHYALMVIFRGCASLRLAMLMCRMPSR
jgi:hypothetical protein